MPNINFDFALPVGVATSVATNIPTQTAVFSGISTGVISDGTQVNFWGQNHTINGGSLSNGVTYYIMTGSDYPDLVNLYQGDPVISTLWILDGTNQYSFPVKIDGSGIYFTCNTGGVSFNQGAVFGFKFGLILNETPTGG